jgi:ABC-type multidrug transport system fused ATPase/permease subunit
VQQDTLRRLLDGYFHLDWRVFRNRHDAHYYRRSATTAIDAAYVAHQCATLISSSLMIGFLAALTLWVYPLISLGLGVAFMGMLILMQWMLGRAQKRAAHAREAALGRWTAGMAEAFSAFREIRVYRLERFFLDRFGTAIAELAANNRRLDYLPVLPRLIMDFMIFGVVLLVVAFWLVLDRPTAELLPLLVFFAIVARSILPAMMNVLSIRAQLYGSIVNIELVLEEFARNRSGRRETIQVAPSSAEPPRFALCGVTFRHDETQRALLENADFEIVHPCWLALTGPSGIGKSTVMELLCGIHRPEKGQVVHQWPAGEEPRLAYVPQAVVLLDATVAENVVFGFDRGDAERIKRALDHAGLGDAVARLADGMTTLIGANGSRLSGGERQRLAIARALYRRPDLLLLDEATSGLDEATEHAVLSVIQTHYPDMSVVFITHRPGNLAFADRVARLSDGRLNLVAKETSAS